MDWHCWVFDIISAHQRVFAPSYDFFRCSSLTNHFCLLQTKIPHYFRFYDNVRQFLLVFIDKKIDKFEHFYCFCDVIFVIIYSDDIHKYQMEKLDMFQEEYNGYKKSEVDSFIQQIKTSYEAKLMAEKLKVLDAEKKVLDIKNERQQIESKEKNIMNALNVIEKQKRFQEEGSKKIYSLVASKLELLINELELKYPQFKHEKGFVELLNEFKKVVSTFKLEISSGSSITNPVNSENDSMRVLLNKMQEYRRGQESAPKEVHIKTTQKPATASQQQTKEPITNNESESGFNLEEALNPTDDLEEIMKAFDFYNE